MKKVGKLRKSSYGTFLPSLSKTEYKLIEQLDEHNLRVFTIKEVQILLLCKKRKAYDLVYNLEKKGILLRLKRGRYAVSFLSKIPDLLEVSSKMIWPSYISFWTALSYYGFTEQIPRSIFLCTTKAKRLFMLNNTKIEFVKISQKRFFGYTKINNIIIAEKEKAIIDSLLLSRYAGGIAEVFKSICNAWNQIDRKLLIKYALRVQNKSLIKRLGYLIEYGKLKIEKELLNKLRKRIGKGYSKLDPQLPKTGIYNKKWQLIVNVKKLSEWRRIL